MATVNLTNDQVIDLVRQLPPDRKRQVLLTLAGGAQVRGDERTQLAEKQLRRICAENNLNWDAMSEDEREAFVDELIHEDRLCGT